LGKKVLNGTFGFPDANALPGSDTVLSFIILGDEVFRLNTHIMSHIPGN